MKSDVNSKSEEISNDNQPKMIHTKTWTHDSHGLFDYESSSIKSSSLLPENSGNIYRDNKYNIVYFKKSENAKVSEQDKTNTEQILGHLEINKLQNKIFLSTNVSQDLPINNQTLTD